MVHETPNIVQACFWRGWWTRAGTERRVGKGSMTTERVVQLVYSVSYHVPSKLHVSIFQIGAFCIRYGVTANIAAFHAAARGSIPRIGSHERRLRIIFLHPLLGLGTRRASGAGRCSALGRRETGPRAPAGAAQRTAAACSLQPGLAISYRIRAWVLLKAYCVSRLWL